MLKLLISPLVLFLSHSYTPASGDWTGTLVLDGADHEVHLTVRESDFGLIGRLAFMDLGRRFIAPVSFRDSVRLAVQTDRFGYVQIAASIEGDRMHGTVRGTAPGSVVLRRIDRRCGVCDAAAGEYASGRDTLLLTHRPRGGMLMVVFGPGGLSLGQRFPVGGSLVRLDRNGDVVETLTFRRNDAGDIVELRGPKADGSGSWRRIRPGIRQREVRFRSGDVGLTGTLYEPTTERPVAGVATIQGSLGGRIASRENFWQLLFARGLVHRGVAVLVPDKRGSGSSEGEWTLATVEDLADDAVASIEALREHLPDGTPVGFGALSEGGWVAPVAASRPGAADFVVSVSASALDGEQTTAYEVSRLAEDAGLSEEVVKEVLELQERAAAYGRSGSPEDWDRYLVRRAELLERPETADVVAPFPTEVGDPRIVQFVQRRDFDPMPHWARVEVPVFAVWGGEDVRVPAATSYERLSRLFDATTAGPNHELILFDQSGHSIEDPRTGRLREEFLERVVRWLERIR